MDTASLRNKTILLTGGSEGIGRECALAYAREGARVAVLALPDDALASIGRELGPEHLVLACDVGDDAQVRAAVSRTLERFGKLDAIHNNAGIAHPSKPLHETDDGEWDALFRVNLRSVLLTARHGYAALKDSRGCILNTSSMVGELGQPAHAAYTATKGAMNALTKSMALDGAKHGIRVNAILPAGVLTPMVKRWTAEQEDPEATLRALDTMHALGYCPGGDVIADAAVFLISDKARFITGCLLPVSGGAELGYRR